MSGRPLQLLLLPCLVVGGIALAGHAARVEAAAAPFDPAGSYSGTYKAPGVETRKLDIQIEEPDTTGHFTSTVRIELPGPWVVPSEGTIETRRVHGKRVVTVKITNLHPIVGDTWQFTGKVNKKKRSITGTFDINTDGFQARGTFTVKDTR